jgi:hypothetical protein
VELDPAVRRARKTPPAEADRGQTNAVIDPEILGDPEPVPVVGVLPSERGAQGLRVAGGAGIPGPSGRGAEAGADVRGFIVTRGGRPARRGR